eukprot:TRINITY_DN112454_c0_g1_i1.p1 TRINITY_DN112454_c0_g1~~TRINITY_DN112454_c0_g1_i1.p1  ORF type:complete len:443 (+),score=69.99 TRINITY_DN112454_c0_g1_i1:49-1329(+)
MQHQIEEVTARAKANEDEAHRVKWELEECQQKNKQLEGELQRLRWEKDDVTSRAKTAEEEVQQLKWETEDKVKSLEDKNQKLKWDYEEVCTHNRRFSEDIEKLRHDVQLRCQNNDDQANKIVALTHLLEQTKAVSALQVEELVQRLNITIKFMEMTCEGKLEALAAIHDQTIAQYRVWIKRAREDQKQQRLYPYLGLEIAEEVPLAEHIYTGVKVSTVRDRGPACIAGISEDDTIREIHVVHKTTIQDLYDFRIAIEKVRHGDSISFFLTRDGTAGQFVRELVVQASERDHHKPPQRRKTGKISQVPLSPMSDCSAGTDVSGRSPASKSGGGQSHSRSNSPCNTAPFALYPPPHYTQNEANLMMASPSSAVGGVSPTYTVTSAESMHNFAAYHLNVTCAHDPESRRSSTPSLPTPSEAGSERLQRM